MGLDASAYRVLGLEPGAEPAAVEGAYRTLIKRHHPDRPGGDSARAAEINWAYHHIRKAQRASPIRRRPSYPLVRTPPPRVRSRPARWLGLALAVGLAILAFQRSEFEISLAGLAKPMWRLTSERPTFVKAAAPAELGDQPLDSDAIDRSVLSASRLASAGDVERLAGLSRRCHSSLRIDPELSRLDQCVAFDEAAVVLLEYNRLDAGGQFSTSAVTSRQLGAARLFSEDYFAIESRLDRIRSHVEFSLAPPDPRPAPPLEL